MCCGIFKRGVGLAADNLEKKGGVSHVGSKGVGKGVESDVVDG